MANDCDARLRSQEGFTIFVAVPTVIIWLIGVGAAVLLFPGMCNGCEISARMCAVISLSITSAVIHGIIALVEVVIFWASGLWGRRADWVAGLLLLKNLLCLGTEVTMAVCACGVRKALAARRAAEHEQERQPHVQMTSMTSMESMVQMQQQLALQQQQLEQQMQAAGMAPPAVVGQSAPAVGVPVVEVADVNVYTSQA